MLKLDTYVQEHRLWLRLVPIPPKAVYLNGTQGSEQDSDTGCP